MMQKFRVLDEAFTYSKTFQNAERGAFIYRHVERCGASSLSHIPTD